MLFYILIFLLSWCEYQCRKSEVAVGSLIPSPKFIIRKSWKPYSVDCITFDIIPTKSNLIIDQAIIRFYKNTFHDRTIEPPTDLLVLTSLVLDIKDFDVALTIGVDESYNISFDGSIATLKSSTTWGALRGMETFSQMIHQRITDDKYVIIPHTIQDYPSMKYRGIMVDAATAFLKIETVEKFIDSMSFVKYNILILQLSNDENFAFTSKKYPELHQKRSLYGNLFPTDTLKHLIEYAYIRGIIIEPQFRIPESSSSWGSIPKISIPCGVKIYDKPLLQINPILGQTVDIVSDVLIEASKVFKNTYLYLGEKASNYSCWMNDAEISNYAKKQSYNKDYRALDVEFLSRVENKVKENYKGVVYSADLINDINPPPNGSILLVKNYSSTTDDIRKLIKKGYNIIHAGCFNLTKRTVFTEYQRFFNCPLVFWNLTEAELANVVGITSFIDKPTDANLFTTVYSSAYAVADSIWNANRPIVHGEASVRYLEQDCRFFRRGIPARNLLPSSGCRYDLID